MRVCRLSLVFVTSLFICALQGRAQRRPGPVAVDRVLVIENTRSDDSVAIANYYQLKHKLPRANLVRIEAPLEEECSLQEFRDQVEAPIKRYLAASKLKIDYILLTKGMPIRTHEGPAGGFSVDSLLATMDWTQLTTRSPNPYFGRSERFSHSRYNLYLVTRLIGYTRADCLRLVDDALAAKPSKGPFLIHTGPGHEDDGYRPVNDGMREAHSILTRHGLVSILDTANRFPGSSNGLAGYFSWGSNDSRFDKEAYNSLHFLTGAIAETAVSTSARTFEDPNASGQSLIGDLVAQGVTGCKGYVSEPFADSIARADILFARYTAGYTLAESFYMASQYIHWKDMVIGDPICAPYSH
jgi:uncharacterized protein (TIGR03790 family)